MSWAVAVSLISEYFDLQKIYIIFIIFFLLWNPMNYNNLKRSYQICFGQISWVAALSLRDAISLQEKSSVRSFLSKKIASENNEIQEKNSQCSDFFITVTLLGNNYTGDALQQVRVEKRYMLLACFCCLVDRYTFVPVQLVKELWIYRQNTQIHSRGTQKPLYRMPAIITLGLYFFYHIFHCGLYCREVTVTDSLCTK